MMIPEATDDHCECLPHQARVTIMTLHNLPPSMGGVLVDECSHKTPDEAHAILEGQDVIVTNQSDKDIQLAKLKVLNERL